MADISVIVIALGFLAVSTSAVTAMATPKPCLAETFYRYVPPESRIDLESGIAKKPVNLWVLNWESSALASEIAKILIEEALGYHVTTSPEGGMSWTAFYSIAGCADPLNYLVDAQCMRTQDFKHHVSLEVWGDGKFPVFEKYMRENNLLDMMPENLGSIGYDGIQGTYVFTNILNDASADSGLPLEFYKSYNLSWYQPWRYFGNMSAIAPSRLKLCNQTRMVDKLMLFNHVTVTGDEEGVIVNETNGELTMARCWQNSWWISPACREQIGQCIPWITGSRGWGIFSWMQKAAYYKLPVAVAVAKDNTEWRRIPQEFRILTYWWQPDISFMEFRPQLMIFPPRNKEEWAASKMITSSSDLILSKLVYNKMHTHSPRLWQFVQKFQIAMLDMETMLYSHKVKHNSTYWDTACEWIRGANIWRKWLPDPTECLPGYGLINSSGHFLDSLHLDSDPGLSRINATGCELCPAGRASLEYLAHGRTFACQSCHRGSFAKDRGMTECVECPAGFLAGELGSRACTACPIGSYATKIGSSECSQCGESRDTFHKIQNRWIQFFGAKSASDCGCKEGTQPNHVGVCIQCTEGLHCPGKDEVIVLVGYAYDHESLSTYKCFRDSLRCPGGAPGVCAPGRINTSIACAECDKGKTQGHDGSCSNCGGTSRIFVICVVSCFALLLIVFYVLTDQGFFIHGKGSSRLILGTLAAQLLGVLQSLGILSSISIEWTRPLSDLLPVFSMFVFDVEVLKPNCVIRIDAVQYFLAKFMIILFATAFLVVIHLCHIMIYKSALKDKMPSLIACITMICMAFFLSLISTILSPFHCNSHPNGLSTLWSHQSLHCWEGGQHNTMLVLGLSACVLPVGFMASMVWVISVFPTRMRRGDLYYFRCWACVFFRFRPAAYWYAPVIPLRSAFLAAGLLFSIPTAQTYYSLIILLFSFASILYTKPWMKKVCNYCDMISFLVLTLFAATALAFTDHGKAANLSYIVVGLLTLAFVAILSGFAHVCVQCVIKMRKPFQFFLCHYKKEAGSFVRLLKMYLIVNAAVTRKVFIDSDDLTDLTKLFEYVRSSTDVFVLVHSNNSLTRPWCVGEFVTARKNRIKLIRIVFPCVDAPGIDFVLFYENLVPHVSDLFDFGITLADVKQALESVSQMMWVDLPETNTISRLTFMELSFALVAFFTKSDPGTYSMNSSIATDVPHDTRAIILADTTNTEAMCTGFIVHQFMIPFFAEDVSRIPQVLQETHGTTIQSNIKDALIICTAGLFERKFTAMNLIVLAEMQAQVLPIISDDRFRFPDARHLQTIHSALVLQDLDADKILCLIPMVFKEIAIVFNPSLYSTTQSVIDAKINEISLRLRKNDRSRLVYKSSGSNLSASTADSAPFVQLEYSPRLGSTKSLDLRVGFKETTL